MTSPEVRCSICGSPLAPPEDPSSPCPLSEAGEWVSREICADDSPLCPRCRENRALLALMYVIDR